MGLGVAFCSELLARKVTATQPEQELPRCLRTIFTYSNVFGGTVFLKAVSQMANILNLDPTSYPKLAAQNLPETFLRYVVKGTTHPCVSHPASNPLLTPFPYFQVCYLTARPSASSPQRSLHSA